MPAPRTVLVLGAGIVAWGCAWLLQRRGHAVTLVAADFDEPLLPPQGACGGSRAALGVLMGQVFHRRSGRAWRLRQRSLELWPEWRRQLAQRGQPVPWRAGLLLLAGDAAEWQRLERLAHTAGGDASGLRLLRPGSAADLSELAEGLPLMPVLPGAGRQQGALFSPADGQLDPLATIRALRHDALAAGLVGRAGVARALQPAGAGGDGNGGWRLELEGGEALEADWLVLAGGCGTTALLAQLHGGTAEGGAAPLLEPVLGQALELELDAADAAPAANGDNIGPSPWRGWPGAVVWRGVNLVPRPDLPGGRRLWLGATVEPGRHADPQALAQLRELEGAAPDWLRRARLLRHWHGLRPRPAGRPAPLLEELAQGLLLAAGHHRNGVLLTPASAEWVCARIEATRP